jgi:hypothetical protein
VRWRCLLPEEEDDVGRGASLERYLDILVTVCLQDVDFYLLRVHINYVFRMRVTRRALWLVGWISCYVDLDMVLRRNAARPTSSE